MSRHTSRDALQAFVALPFVLAAIFAVESLVIWTVAMACGRAIAFDDALAVSAGLTVVSAMMRRRKPDEVRESTPDLVAATVERLVFLVFTGIAVAAVVGPLHWLVSRG